MWLNSAQWSSIVAQGCHGLNAGTPHKLQPNTMILFNYIIIITHNTKSDRNCFFYFYLRMEKEFFDK
ncbi:hypothetical protein HK25_00185 [Acetobacter sp. DsW_059]|nr:hypothetical protein HK25_00185 [Acetobacter sp. DsW_059]